MSPADISWSSDTLVQPDLFVVAKEEMRTLDWTKMRTLLLAIEVLSLSSSRSDRFSTLCGGAAILAESRS